ncbi:MAG: hypothetical protein RIT45_446 [Pseudomonadota bacterium]
MSARAALLEAALVTAGLAGWIALVDRLGAAIPLVASLAGALVALAFLGTPLLMARLGRVEGDPLGAGPGKPLRALAIGAVAGVVVLLPFALGYDQVARHLWGERRWAGIGLPSRGVELQGVPPPVARVAGDRLAVWEVRGAIALRNDGARPLTIAPICDGCRARVLAPGGRDQLGEPEASGVRVLGPDGAAVPHDAIRLGRHGIAAAGQPVSGPANLGWLLLLLLDQLIVVALPEEVLFRGWMLGRLRAALPPGRRVLGVPFGAAHIASAAFFALVHLAATPAAHRLLVFFPALLFAWLAERARHVAAPALHHALSNVVLQALGRLYGS